MEQENNEMDGSFTKGMLYFKYTPLGVLYR